MMPIALEFHFAEQIKDYGRDMYLSQVITSLKFHPLVTKTRVLLFDKDITFIKDDTSQLTFS